MFAQSRGCSCTLCLCSWFWIEPLKLATHVLDEQTLLFSFLISCPFFDTFVFFSLFNLVWLTSTFLDLEVACPRRTFECEESLASCFQGMVCHLILAVFRRFPPRSSSLCLCQLLPTRRFVHLLDSLLQHHTILFLLVFCPLRSSSGLLSHLLFFLLLLKLLDPPCFRFWPSFQAAT